jgi:hypothetical protein
VVIDFPSSWPTPRPQKHPLTPNPKAKHPKDQRPPPKPQSPRYDQNRSANSEIGRIHYPQWVKNCINIYSRVYNESPITYCIKSAVSAYDISMPTIIDVISFLDLVFKLKTWSFMASHNQLLNFFLVIYLAEVYVMLLLRRLTLLEVSQ